MKLSESKKTRIWLKENGFSSEEIFMIKDLFEKEGIRFCVKSFRKEDLDGLKKEISDIKKKENMKYYKELLESVDGVDIESALEQLLNH